MSCLYELNIKIDLYKYAMELVDTMNKEAVTWFAVGMVYLRSQKNMEAREHFKTALELDQLLPEAWLGYGHSFAYKNDHDQAIAAYKEARRLAPE